MSLLVVQADGSTLREHLTAAGATDVRLTAQPPAGTQELWRVVLALSAQRTEPVSTKASELDAWQRLHGVRLSPWEVETVQAADQAVAAVLRKQAAANRSARS